ncbi:hypothetical protein F5Y11DRAFT_352365 [Daldinia sp. FL1419]|nr:hypothetical protein F5Y11DRAFT_352365 [Daldinia sp. FL1419]
MSRRSSCVSDDNRRPQSKTASQRNHKSPDSQPRSPHASSNNKLPQNPTNTRAHNPSPLKMVTTTSASHLHSDETLHYYLPDTNARETELQTHGWMEPIVIDDEDLMFSGKSLSTWYEEERKSLNVSVEEERRGRQRVRQHNSHTHHHHHHHHHHRHHPSSTTTSNVHEQK